MNIRSNNEYKNNYSFAMEEFNNVVSSFDIDNIWSFQLGSARSDSIFTPWYITGIIDGEGSFQCEISFPNKTKLYPSINFSLQVKQSNHDVAVLYAIKKFFQFGYKA